MRLLGAKRQTAMETLGELKLRVEFVYKLFERAIEQDLAKLYKQPRSAVNEQWIEKLLEHLAQCKQEQARLKESDYDDVKLLERFQ